MLKIDCSTDRIQIARIALILPSSIVPGGAGEYIAGALTHGPDRFLLASDSYNYLGYKTGERKTISRPHFSSPQPLLTSSSCSYLGVIRCEGSRFSDKVGGEPLDHLLVLMVHDVDHLPLEAHQHLLRPDAGGLLHGQEPAHAIGRVHQVVLGGHCECGQVLQQVGRRTTS